jgi:hypothetical protein
MTDTISSTSNPFVAGITYFDATTGTFIAQACVDATSMAQNLANWINNGAEPS